MKRIFFIFIISLCIFFPYSININAEEYEYIEYTIKKGDTLWDISGGTLDDPLLWSKIWKKNPHIKNPDLIYPGQMIRIPKFILQKRQIEVIPPEEETAPEKPPVPPEKPLKEDGNTVALVLKKEVKEEIEVIPSEEETAPEKPPVLPKKPLKEDGNTVALVLKEEVKEKIALLPFGNLSDNKDVLIYVMPLLKSRLEEKGLKLVDEDSLNKFLLKERIRATDYISKGMAQKIREELNVNAILVGSVISFSPEENPQIGLLARLIDSSNGFILWADYSSATGDDFATILRLGRLKTMDGLTSRVVDKLLASFSIMPPHKEIEPAYRIAVMPFQNKSRFRDAGMIATYMFLVELFKNRGFETVEYGEVRRLIVDLRVRDRGELDYENIEALSDPLEVDGILVGTVELYSDSVSPRVAITARLLDVRKNKILWYNNHRLNGEDDIIVFDWGNTNPVDKVAYKVISELVKKMERVKWH